MSINLEGHIGLGGKGGITIGSDGVAVQGQVGVGFGAGADAKYSESGGVGESEAGAQVSYCGGVCKTTNYRARDGYLEENKETSYGSELGGSIGYYGKLKVFGW